MNLTDVKKTIEMLPSLGMGAKIIMSAGGVISMVVGGWLFLATTFTSAEDFEQYKEVMGETIIKETLQGEQAINELRIDVLEERLDRVHEADPAKKKRLERQLDRLELRNLDLQRQLDQIQ